MNDFSKLDRMAAIGLEDMDSIRLMNRIDSKYLTDSRTLTAVLGRAVEEGFLVFEVMGQRVNGYKSMYYDTPSLQMYLDHHNRRLVRQKVRTRCYLTAGLTFLELKSKNNHGRTKKKRMEIAPELYRTMSISDPAECSWLEDRLTYPLDRLTPSLETSFSRITLVNPEKTERCTIDFDLHFNNVRKGTTAGMGDLVIIEVKQDGNLPSKFRDILLECRVKPVRISKYCIGTALTDKSIKSGRFKRKLMLINKMNTQI